VSLAARRYVALVGRLGVPRKQAEAYAAKLSALARSVAAGKTTARRARELARSLAEAAS
jgi:hypothetical protein